MKNVLCVLIIAAAALFISATVWEGSAAVSGGDLPGGEASIATNAFPKNTVVHVTNLENNKSVAVIVATGLESTSGLLAALSKTAAESIGLKDDSVIRIRMTQPSESVAFSRYRTGPGQSAPSNQSEGASPLPKAKTDIPAIDSKGSSPSISLVEDNERIPEAPPTSDITSGQFADPIPSEKLLDENGYTFVDTISGEKNAIRASPAEIAFVPPADFSPFQAPLIGSLETGKWYIQLGAYTRPDHVEDEISRIGSAYPLAIQNAGTDIDPLFRILLGPMNRGESAATLQQIKSIGYKDAFERNR